MLKALIALLFFQLCGETLVSVLHSPIPGPVAGMLLLWIALAIKGGPSKDLDQVSHTLIQYLSLFFLPAGVGLFFLPASVQQYWPAILAAMLVGTLASMLFSGFLMKRLSAKKAGAE
ncbi:CidA/LrgA family protein [Aestuariicella hydrocarbonica]|uniref:CidA/LrgA family protein n=1 Tax=Pseudomaricurvus hydrocarbonicus TaxID=1470433 RepID=A0A9E5MQD9_9GAMM|nr:CidA/LrgA family protein [Aestuariicella hydrocarbonica]NHO68422.1 CidA/LrgA family protein [Aestuariicella hydrocarbonica]